MLVVSRELKVDTTGVGEAAALADLGLDSLAIAELMFALEEEFGIDVSDINVTQMPATVAEVIQIIDERLAAQT
jgi:acyl carrier protein